MPSKKINWTSMLLISFFLGSLGIDRIMMGQFGWGLLKILTFGGLGIWWLLDFIFIAAKHDFTNIEWV